MSIIEKGLKEKLRFNVNGNNTIEDLYDFNSEVLASLGGKLFEQVKQFTSDNPFKTVRKTKAQEKLQLSYDVVKYIYDLKVTEEEESINATQKKAELNKALEIRSKANQASLEEKISKMTDEEFAIYTASLR